MSGKAILPWGHRAGTVPGCLAGRAQAGRRHFPFVACELRGFAAGTVPAMFDQNAPLPGKGPTPAPPAEKATTDIAPALGGVRGMGPASRRGSQWPSDGNLPDSRDGWWVGPPATRPFKFNARCRGMQARSRKVVKVIRWTGKHALFRDAQLRVAPGT